VFDQGNRRKRHAQAFELLLGPTRGNEKTQEVNDMTKSKDGPPPVEPPNDPFGKNIASEQLLKHHQLEQLRTLMRSAIHKQAIALVTGPPGVGKTTAVRSVTDELPSHKYAPVYLGQDQSSVNVLRRFAQSLGIQPKFLRTRMAMQISQWLLDNLSAGGKEIVLIVDEAHLLDDATLEDFRLMTNANYDRQSPLTVILLGQPILRVRLKSSEFEALSQRIPYRYCLEGLDEDETATYIQLRLSAAGLSPDTFSQEALQYIFQVCQGILRRINNLCSLALLKAKSKKLQIIDAAFLKELTDLD
jgi:type II secretory pathway predicted ATPase ExeA